MARKRTITIDTFEPWEVNETNPAEYLRVSPSGERFFEPVLVDDNRLLPKDLDHYTPYKLANSSYKIWSKINEADATRLLDLFDKKYKGSFFAVYDFDDHTFRVRLRPLKDMLELRIRHIKDARKFRKKIAGERFRQIKQERDLAEAVAKLDHDVRVLYKSVLQIHVPEILAASSFMRKHALRKAARRIGSEMYEIQPYTDLGLVSLEAKELTRSKRTPEHIHSRQQSGKKIVDFMIEEVQNGNVPDYAHFISLVHKANEVVWVTSDQNTAMRDHQNSDDEPSPFYVYKCQNITLEREHEYQIHERWEILGEMYGVEFEPPYDFGRLVVDPN